MPSALFAPSELLVGTDHFTYLGFTNKSNQSLGREIAGVLARLNESMGKKAANHERHTQGGHYTRRVSSVPCCMAVNHGWLTPRMRTTWNAFTFAAYDKSSTSHGKTKYQTLSCWCKLAPWARIFSVSVEYSMNGTYAPNEGRLHTKGCHVRRTGHRTPSSRSSSSALKGHFQARPETHRHLPRQPGTACSDRSGWRLAVWEGVKWEKEWRSH